MQFVWEKKKYTSKEDIKSLHTIRWMCKCLHEVLVVYIIDNRDVSRAAGGEVENRDVVQDTHQSLHGVSLPPAGGTGNIFQS